MNFLGNPIIFYVSNRKLLHSPTTQPDAQMSKENDLAALLFCFSSQAGQDAFSYDNATVAPAEQPHETQLSMSEKQKLPGVQQCLEPLTFSLLSSMQNRKIDITLSFSSLCPLPDSALILGHMPSGPMYPHYWPLFIYDNWLQLPLWE